MDGYYWTWGSGLLLAAAAASIIRQRRAVIALQSKLGQAEQRLSAIHQIALSLSTTLDVNRLLEVILEQLGRLWGYDYGAVLLLNEARTHLTLASARGYLPKAGYQMPATEGICGAVIQTGQPVLVADVKLDPRYVPGVSEAQSELAVPLVWENQIIGVLNVESRVTEAYTEADIALLTTVAEQAAAAIASARLHHETRVLAITDEHTGLYNYRHFQAQVTAAVRQSQLVGHACSLIMLDLDLFKRCNDTYGHPTGDAILEQVAHVLRDACRHEDLIFRYGGEEFAILLPQSDCEAALRVAERIRAKMASYPFTTLSGRHLDFALTASLGVATAPTDGLTSVDLVLAADKALYAAKTSGRNQVLTAAQANQVEIA